MELRIAFKPTSTITSAQNTVNRDGVDVELKARGRHDPCVVPRAVPMVESMVALTLMDALMQQKAQCELLDFEADGGFNPLGSKPVHDLGVVPASA